MYACAQVSDPFARIRYLSAGTSRLLFMKSPEAFVEISRQHSVSDTTGRGVLEMVLQTTPQYTHCWRGTSWGLTWDLKALEPLVRGLSVHLKSVISREGHCPCDCSLWNFWGGQSRKTENPVRLPEPCGVEVPGSQGCWSQSPEHWEEKKNKGVQ